MRLPFVSVATYDWAIRHSERLADEAERERERGQTLLKAWQEARATIDELTDTIVSMKRENFVVDIPVTNTALSVDEADEYSVADESAQSALLKRKLGS